MKENFNNRPGLLPHELIFVRHAIDEAREELKKANLAYGDAVASSDGDWAFDDASSQIAANEANQREKYLQHLLGIVSVLGKKDLIIDYPETTNKYITYGSSIVVKINDTELNFFIGTQKIPGLDTVDDIEIISAKSPMGSSLIGKVEGETATWTLPNGEILSAIIIEIDQSKMKGIYEQ